jgi:hypothetical protein
MARAKRTQRPNREKRVEETLHLSGKRRGAVLEEEVWYEGRRLAKYSLAYVNRRICSVDNGRVLGYDNTHEYHHRHFMGKVERIEFPGYEALLTRFEREVHALWKTEDADERKR